MLEINGKYKLPSSQIISKKIHFLYSKL